MLFPTMVKFCDQHFLQLPGQVIPSLPDSPHFHAQQHFIHYLRTLEYSSVLDLGAGSGLLGISLWRPNVRLTMTDLNPQAVSLAQANSRRLSVPSECLLGSWFDPVQGQYDLIIANPPHGTSCEWQQYTWAHPWVPQSSVDGGHDGLDCVRSLLAGAAKHLCGSLYLIYTQEQHTQVLAFAQSNGFHCDHMLEHMGTVMGCYSLKSEI